MAHTWREHFAPMIRAAIEHGEALSLTGRDLERFVRRTTRPGRSNGYWPVKAWAKEIRFQLGLDPPPGRVRRKATPPAPGQLLMPMPPTDSPTP